MQVLETIEQDAIARLRAATEYFWLDLCDPDAAEVARLGELFGLHEIVAEDLVEFGQRPKLDDYEHYTHLVFYGVERHDLLEVHVIVHGEALITVRRGPSEALAAARGRVQQTDASREEYAVYLVLDALTDSFFPLLEELEDHMDELEDAIIESRGAEPIQAHMQRFADKRRRLSAMRRVIGPQRDLMAGAGDFMDRIPGLRSDEAHDYYRDVYDHLLRIGDGLDSLRDVLTGIHDIYLSAQSNRLNEIVYRLTVVGTIFLPMTFVTGFFGQNFGWLVGHVDGEWAFWALGIGLEVASVVALVAWFRRAGIRE